MLSYRRNRLVSSVLALLFVFLLPVTTLTASAAEQRLLLIYSYSPTFQSTGKFLQGLKEGLGDAHVEIDIEYMDSKSLHDDTSEKNFYTLLKYKLLRKAPYDYVVTCDDIALRFVLQYQDELFSEIPITFVGVNNIELAKAQNTNPYVTGVAEAASLDSNIKMAQHLLPEHQQIVVVVDDTTSGRADKSIMLKLLPKYKAVNWQFLNLSAYSWAEFKSKLNRIDSASTAVILLSAYRDKKGDSLTFSQSLQVMVENTDAAIFHPYEYGLGDGVLGGVMVSHRQQAYEAGTMVTKFMAGTPVQDIPVVETSPNIPMFDYRLLKEHAISTTLLPDDSRLYFKEPVFIHAYSDEIMAFLLLIVIMLIIHNLIRFQKNRHTKASEKKLRTILDSIDAYIYLKDVAGRYLFANKKTQEIFGLTSEQIVGKSDFELMEHDTAAKVVNADQQVLKLKHRYSQDESIWRQDLQSQRDLRTTKTPLLDESLKVYALCGVSIDITAQKQHERLLEQAVFYDSLTGLPNRLAFMERLTQAMRMIEEYNNRLYLAFVDIDGFKLINEQYGHDFGDSVIKGVVTRVQEFIGENSVVARLGGDEFYWLYDSDSDGRKEVEQLLDCINEPMVINANKISITASVGVTSYPQSAEVGPEHLMRQVEQALFVAKSYGINHIEYFQGDPLFQQGSERYNQLISAFTNNEFVMYYQPKVSLTNGELVGVEALIRWSHPEEGILAPAMFLPDIEQYHLIKKLDDWVIDDVLRQVSSWHKSGFTIPVSINLSHAYFRQRNIASILHNKLSQYPDLPPSLIEMEIIETNALENLAEVADTIRSCNELEIKFSLDDFGTGYSSLTYLQQLPVNTLKVDRSFVIDMLTNSTDRSILEGILGFCRAFKLTAVAEGVETLEHGLELKKMGFHIAQGYGIAKPMPRERLLDWAESWEAPGEWLSQLPRQAQTIIDTNVK